MVFLQMTRKLKLFYTYICSHYHSHLFPDTKNNSKACSNQDKNDIFVQKDEILIINCTFAPFISIEYTSSHMAYTATGRAELNRVISLSNWVSMSREHTEYDPSTLAEATGYLHQLQSPYDNATSLSASPSL